MSRPLRITYDGAWYHVMNRGAGRRVIFPAPASRNVFLTLLGDVTTTLGIEIHAYCLMDTHDYCWYARLAAISAWPCATTTASIPSVTIGCTRRMGHYFGGRFKAILVDADTYLAQLSRYIHLNPILATMPKKAFDPDWSSYPVYLGQVPAPSWLHLRLTLGLFGTQGARQHYQAFVESGVDEELQAFFSRKRLLPLLGGKDFRRRIAPLCEDKRGHPDVPDTKSLRSQPTLSGGIRVRS